jgi:opacity protein-like surface antigen
MMGKNKLGMMFLAILFFFLTPASPATAKDGDPGNSIGLKLGAYSPQHDNMEDFNEGFNGEIFYGLRFHRNFAAELGAGYFKASGKFPGVDFSLKVIDILYTVKGIIPLGILDIYGGPGIGVYFAKVNVSSTLPGFAGGDSDMSTSFGYHILAGANFNITREVFLGIEGKYFWAKTNESILPKGGAFGSHLDGATATANIGYRF